MTTSLKTIWTLWEKAEIKGWENGKPEGSKPDVYKAPEPTKEKSYERPKVVDAQKETPSGLNSLEDEETFIPGKDKDADLMQLEAELDRLEEALFEYELEEAFLTPDVGTSNYGLGLLGGGIGLSIGNTYDRNYCPDPTAPEEVATAPSLDPSNNILAPKQFIPKEDRALAEHIAWNQRVRRQKIEG